MHQIKEGSLTPDKTWFLSAKFTGWFALPCGRFSVRGMVAGATRSFQTILAQLVAMLLWAGSSGWWRAWKTRRWLTPSKMWGWTPLVMVGPSTPRWWRTGSTGQRRAPRGGTGTASGNDWAFGWCLWTMWRSWTLTLGRAPWFLRSILKNLSKTRDQVWIRTAAS